MPHSKNKAEIATQDDVNYLVREFYGEVLIGATLWRDRPEAKLLQFTFVSKLKTIENL
jgi:hypothetical protein